MIADSIKNTLCYAHIFNYPLKVGELYQKLISPKTVNPDKFDQTLNNLVVQKRVGEYQVNTRVGETEKFFTLYQKSPQNIISTKTRIQREKYSREKLKKTRRVGKWLKKINSIQAVYITGSLAVKNVQNDDDIDLMIITKPNQLWLTRFIVTMFFELIHLRRRPNDHNLLKDKFCLNLYLASDRLHLKKSRQNLYTAHEIIQSKPLWSRQMVHFNYLHQNHWVTNFLPHSPLPQTPTPTPKFSTKFLFVPNTIMLLLEKTLYKLQITYMKNKQTKEKVSSGSAFFHPRNTSQIVLDQYQQLISST